MFPLGVSQCLCCAAPIMGNAGNQSTSLETTIHSLRFTIANRGNTFSNQITGSYQDWTAFLEQLMIYAQRPDATACAGYDV